MATNGWAPFTRKTTARSTRSCTTSIRAIDIPTGCDSAEVFRCWYNTVTSAVSTDWGRSFEHPVEPPGHLVAAITDIYAPDEGIFGAFTPSNIIELDGLLITPTSRSRPIRSSISTPA
jgi:hypothetical protein